MNFGLALKAMKEGQKVKLPSWGGYWCWEKDTIMMHCKDGKVLDIRETDNVEYTMSNIASGDWMLADEESTPVLGGSVILNFGLALEELKKGNKVTKKSWHKEGMYLELQNPTDLSKMTAPYVYITIDNDYRIPWHPSQADMLEEDWELL
ncbi:Protein of unknown function (DUF2829) [[Clostridium] sordellii]|uniref:DUF2829 domain-containing protein n=1 Tax=Paraclostridium sordellii TaxID=1505 RepID=UPI000541FC39|nr:DUF2829 domain-containing protein [Paeniclostridium sordellii]CEK34288.1 Protein of unknown function (DUF2829) [[Clostridium] sordellii] [Paeniclostridium sordellii]